MEATINKGASLPGVLDDSIEFFWDEKQSTLKAIHAGEIWPFLKLPKAVLEKLRSFMEQDEEAMRIMEVNGVWRPEDQLWLFFRCGYGQINQEADYSPDHGLSKPEVWSCSCNGNCCLRHHFKRTASADGIVLSPRQIQVLKALAEFLPDKAVADQLGITIDTLNKHKSQILAKTGFLTKLELVVWAYQHAIL